MTIEIDGAHIKKAITFSGGEPHFVLGSSELAKYGVTIWAYIRTFNDLGELLVVTDALRRMYGSETKIHLCIPYFPGARQDRAQPGEALTVKVYADIINAQKYATVTVHDPHSDVTSALIDNCVVVEQYELAIEGFDAIAEKHKGTIGIVAPDAGAMKKAAKLTNQCPRSQLFVATKTRDVSTGELGAPQIMADKLPKVVLVVDDICDGGGTFIQLAPELKKKGATTLYLYVTHGIFSKGLKPLLEHYDHIFTTDSFYQGESDKNITVLMGV